MQLRKVQGDSLRVPVTLFEEIFLDKSILANLQKKFFKILRLLLGGYLTSHYK